LYRDWVRSVPEFVSGFRLESSGALPATGVLPELGVVVRYETSMFAGQVSPKHSIVLVVFA
jgi:hypothetical protein